MTTIDNTNLINALRSIINEEINNRIDQIVEAKPEFNLEENRYEIEDMIREYLENNVTINLDVV